MVAEPLAKLGQTVTPAQAGVQKSLENLDPGLRWNDGKGFLQAPWEKDGRILK
jgi:hypothetical protein